jgi:hydroxyacylglutathione hydrolase
MIFECIKSEGLAHHSYFISSQGAAAVIDPRRDATVYQERACQHGANIQYILETHRNEDCLSGSLALATLTGGAIYHGHRSDWGYGNIAKDGDLFPLGGLQISALATPGHTDESLSYVLADMETGGQPFMIFSGDTLFVGDTGRIDLYGPAQAPRLAASIYDSIYQKLLPLGDGVILCPAHGAGSVCGANIADRDQSTLGLERQHNQALQKSRAEFIKYKTAEILEHPHYFSQMEMLNRDGPPLLGNLPQPPALSPAQFRSEMEQGILAVDTSPPVAFAGAHVPGAYSIWLGGLSAYSGWFLPYDRPLLLVLEDEMYLRAAVQSLVRIGYDRFAGYLKGGTESWYLASFPMESLPLLTVHELKAKMEHGEDLFLLDVRRHNERQTSYIPKSHHIYVGHLENRLGELPRDRPVAIYCTSGRRAGIAASILKRAGFGTVYNVLGSLSAWVNAGYPIIREHVEAAPRAPQEEQQLHNTTLP